nr:retrovirus-related Pol polyprotein from transposon TNT 1-94 [Tanacetum cinerariifolium]
GDLNAHLKSTYRNLFDSISTLHNTQDTSKNTKFAKQPIEENLPKIGETNALSKPVTSNSVSTPQECKSVNNDKVIALGMFRINPSKTFREEKHIPNTVSASNRTKPITVSQPPVITKNVNSDLNGLSSTGVDNTKTRRPQPRSNTHRNLLLSKNNKHISSACNNIQIDSQDVISKVVCAMCKKCLIFVNHDKCLRNYVNGKNYRGNLKLLINFVWKFMGTVRFGNDHVAAILGFGFCDSDLEVAFRRNACFVRNLEVVDLLKGDRSTNLYIINLHEMASASPICIMARASSTKSWLWHQRLSHLNFDTINDLARNDLVAVERRNRTLVEAARTMLIFSRAPLFLWAKAIATACFTQNGSIIHRRFNKTPYELINGRKLDISFLHVFGALCYPKNDREDIGKLGAKAMPFEQRSSKPRLQSMTSRQISSGLDLTYAPSTIKMQQPTEGELDLLFEATYDDYIGGQLSATERTVLPAQEPQVHQSSTESITIVDTAPTPTNTSSHATNIPITSQDVDEINPNSMVDGNTFVNPFAKPTEKYLKEVKRIFHYLRGTVNTGLWYTKDSGFELIGFSDVDYAGCKDTFKSTSGGAQILGEKLVSWSSKKQDCTALLTAKVEYVSLSA